MMPPTRPQTAAMDERCYQYVLQGWKDWQIEEHLKISSAGRRARRHARRTGAKWPIRKSYTPPKGIASLRGEVKRLTDELASVRRASIAAEEEGEESGRYAASLMLEVLGLIEDVIVDLDNTAPDYLNVSDHTDKLNRLRMHFSRLTQKE